MRPLPPETLKSLRDYYRVGLTYSSNALEGNSLTESETKIVIEDGLTIEGKPLRYVYEAVGHARAYDYLHQLATHKTLEEKDVLELHRLFYQQIDSEQAGKYRTVPVFISGSKYPVTPPQKIATQMDLLRLLDNGGVNWHNGGVNDCSDSEGGGVKLLEIQLLRIIESMLGLNAPALATTLNKSLRTIQRYLKKLTDDEKVLFKGAAKNGGYYIKSE
ncbi:MAG: hypothetical protein VB066_07455 [Paludibacter sp.]|nr:hypothetical protein [Paludibacter sp.]